MINQILKTANQATTALCAKNGIEFVPLIEHEPDFNDSESALKKLFLDGRLDLQIQGKHYCFDDFVGVLFPESEEFQALCALAAKGEPVDFEAVFNVVVDKWIYLTVESMTDSEIQEAIDQL